MDDLDVLARDFGYRPQGKTAPMRSDTSSDRRSPAVRSSTSSFSDVFGGPPKFTDPSSSDFSNGFPYDSIFKENKNGRGDSNSNSNSAKSSLPVYDKPVFDDDIFEGVPGMKSKSMSSSSMRFQDNVFASMATSSPKQSRRPNDQFDDLLGKLGRNDRGPKDGKNFRSSSSRGFDDLLGNLAKNEKVPEPKSSGRNSSSQGFDDLLAGFGSSSPASGSRTIPDSRKHPKSTSAMDDPSVVFDSPSAPPTSSSSGAFTDPLEEISNLGRSGSRKANDSSVSRGDLDDLDPLKGFGQTVSPFFPQKGSREKDGIFISGRQTSSSQKKKPVDNSQEPSLFEVPTASKNPFSLDASSPQYKSPKSEQTKSEEIWLSVSEVPLFTQPTKAPPPSRPPPPIPRPTSKAESGFSSTSFRKKGDEYSPSPKFQNLYSEGRPQNSVDENANAHSSQEMDAAAAAMKDAMDRAEAKFRHAKEVREREHAKAARNMGSVQLERSEHDVDEREFRKNEARLEIERQQREILEERERRRLERERERAEIDRERARQAVERATREARERAAAEARLKAERASAQKVQTEARERAERAAVQRAQAEARERAAAEARERANGEAREKAEARRRAERAAVEKAAAEARERAASRVKQPTNENDLDSFFGTQSSSVPISRASSSDPVFDSQFQTKGGADSAKRTSSTSVSSSNMRKTSTTNIVDDLSSIFGAPSSSGDFQEVEGESEERRRARLDRHQRTQERAAKALAEKNQRDLQAQREQEERSRISETLDFEIKRWAAGKEGNLRALLSTLQYVLWPECGWQPVSLTDLITGASVKKVYRKATLCVHPDKVQQKGATLQQKYIAEKVFDLLKEAWNKFNSEELF